MDYTGVRIRAFARQNFTAFIVVCVVLALVGGWMTYGAYAAVPTSEDAQNTAVWESQGEFNHSATVTNSTEAYAEGETLENRAVYPLEVAPRFHGTYTYSYQAGGSGSLDGEVTLVAVVQSVEGQGDDRTIIWESTEVVGEISFSSLEPGETVDVPFEINMNETATQADQINDDFGNPSGDDEVMLIATVSLNGNVNSHSVETVEDHELRASLDRPLYRVETLSTGSQYGESSPAEAAATPSPTQRFGGPLLLLVALSGLGGLGVAHATGHLRLSEMEETWLEYRNDRQDFDDWITNIRLPDEIRDRPRAEAESLASLVDLAIDTENSVIEDPATDEYYVVHDECLYVYTPPTVADTGEEPADSADSESEPVGQTAEAAATFSDTAED